MSRVEDDREAARQAARVAEQRRQDEAKKKDRVQSDATFGKLVGQAKDEKRAAQQQQTAKESNARSAIAALLEQAESAASQAGEATEHAGLERQQQQGFQGRLGQKGVDERLRHGSRSEGQHAEKLKLLADQGDAHATGGRSTDAQQAGASTDARKADAKAGRERIDERREASEAAKSGRAVPGAEGKGDAGDLKADADKGGQQGGGGGKDEGKGGAGGAPGFRFNPALMAPVPVAQKKDVSGSERLRKIANELAQKIVERVRVGTNALGRAEFQIDMRSDVLSGLTVKVSSHQGKIKAVFSGSDRDVLKLIEQQGEALQAALSARGLSLEEFKVEARA